MRPPAPVAGQLDGDMRGVEGVDEGAARPQHRRHPRGLQRGGRRGGGTACQPVGPHALVAARAPLLTWEKKLVEIKLTKKCIQVKVLTGA